MVMARIIATLAYTQSQQALHTVLRRFPPAAVDLAIDLSLSRRACWEELALNMRYRDLEGRVTRREVWPLGLSYSEGALKFLVRCCLQRDWLVLPRGSRTPASTAASSGRVAWPCCAIVWRGAVRPRRGRQVRRDRPVVAL